LRLLTARPGPDELSQAEHALYGFVSPLTRFSTGAWAEAAEKVIQETAAEKRELIFVGGTGLYFEALTNGFAPVPAIPPAALAEAEAEIAGLDATARLQLLKERDPEMARRLQAPDPQRVMRALAVMAATGRSLATFQDEAQQGLLDGFAVEKLVLNPDREVLRQRIARRFAAMLDEGAIAEVEGLLALDPDPRLPAMKAIGVPEIAAMLAGKLTRAEAVERAMIATRQYAKRQRTWFRNRMGDWTWIDPLGV
jgi:tRNA dimethylallyltransferase